MNGLIKFAGLVIILFFGGLVHAQEQRMIKDVVLLNVEPYEVLMTEKGDIITRIKHLPDYLKTPGVVKPETMETALKPREGKREIVAKTTTEPAEANQVTNSSSMPRVQGNTLMGHYEVSFSKGTATLSNQAISTLNQLAAELNGNPSQRVQVFGFKNESPMVAGLLAKRRQDACIAYLRIKGVNIDQQVTKGSVTEGTTNKIVFGFE